MIALMPSTPAFFQRVHLLFRFLGGLRHAQELRFQLLRASAAGTRSEDTRCRGRRAW